MSTAAPSRNADGTGTDRNIIDRQALRRAVRGAFVGNVMEWYDVGAFGYLIVSLGSVFLPAADQTTQVLFLLGTFAATYLCRPLGGLFFGWLGDRVGRRSVLFLTLSVVIGATCIIGLLPSYATIGIFAPIALVLLKMVQGFSAGGEFTGALTFITESAPDRRRGFYAAFLDAGSYLGFAAGAVIVSALQLLFGQEALESGLWRIPFLIAGPLGIVALILRARTVETPQFNALLAARSDEQLPRTEPIRAFVRNWRGVLLVIALVAAANTGGYAFTSYMPTYLATAEGYTAVQSNMLSTPILILMACSMPFVGMLSDRIGRKPVLYVAFAWALVLSAPAFWLMTTGSWTAVIAGLALIGAPVALSMGTLASTYPAIFPTRGRNTSVGVAYNVSIALFGGTAPLVIDSLIRATGTELSAGIYLGAMALIGLVAARLLKESAGKPMQDSLANVEA